MIEFGMIAVGLLLLFFGGEALIRGSVTIAKHLGISEILIGVVVVGFGTSTPELLVSVKASLAGEPDIALGNVVGSNIANILLILGLAAIITPVICKEKAILRDALVVTLASTILLVLSYIQGISAIAGFGMLASLIAYLVYSYRAERKNKSSDTSDLLIQKGSEPEGVDLAGKPGIGLSILLSLGGIGMLVLGADFLVQGASNLARQAGISEAVIGLSLVAVGTSLPELAAAISAAWKKNSDVIIGNVLGSNLFNILGILGITSLIEPVPIKGQIAQFDIPFNLGVAALSLAIILGFKRFGQVTGALFLVIYALYISWMY